MLGGQLGKSQAQKCFFYGGKGSNHLTFFTVSDMSARQMSMCYCWCMSLSGFFTILPYLVFTMSSPSFMCSFTILVLEHTSSVSFSLLPCKLFITLCSLCIHLFPSLSLEITLPMYVCDFFKCGQEWHQVDLFFMFTSLVMHVVFCSCRCWLNVLSLACNYSSCVGDLYLV